MQVSAQAAGFCDGSHHAVGIVVKLARVPLRIDGGDQVAAAVVGQRGDVVGIVIIADQVAVAVKDQGDLVINGRQVVVGIVAKGSRHSPRILCGDQIVAGIVVQAGQISLIVQDGSDVAPDVVKVLGASALGIGDHAGTQVSGVGNGQRVAQRIGTGQQAIPGIKGATGVIAVGIGDYGLLAVEIVGPVKAGRAAKGLLGRPAIDVESLVKDHVALVVHGPDQIPFRVVGVGNGLASGNVGGRDQVASSVIGIGYRASPRTGGLGDVPLPVVGQIDLPAARLRNAHQVATAVGIDHLVAVAVGDGDELARGIEANLGLVLFGQGKGAVVVVTQEFGRARAGIDSPIVTVEAQQGVDVLPAGGALDDGYLSVQFFADGAAKGEGLLVVREANLVGCSGPTIAKAGGLVVERVIVAGQIQGEVTLDRESHVGLGQGKVAVFAAAGQRLGDGGEILAVSSNPYCLGLWRWAKAPHEFHLAGPLLQGGVAHAAGQRIAWIVGHVLVGRAIGDAAGHGDVTGARAAFDCGLGRVSRRTVKGDEIVVQKRDVHWDVVVADPLDHGHDLAQALEFPEDGVLLGKVVVMFGKVGGKSLGLGVAHHPTLKLALGQDLHADRVKDHRDAVFRTHQAHFFGPEPHAVGGFAGRTFARLELALQHALVAGDAGGHGLVGDVVFAQAEDLEHAVGLEHHPAEIGLDGLPVVTHFHLVGDFRRLGADAHAGVLPAVDGLDGYAQVVHFHRRQGDVFLAKEDDLAGLGVVGGTGDVFDVE